MAPPQKNQMVKQFNISEIYKHLIFGNKNGQFHPIPSHFCAPIRQEWIQGSAPAGSATPAPWPPSAPVPSAGCFVTGWTSQAPGGARGRSGDSGGRSWHPGKLYHQKIQSSLDHWDSNSSHFMSASDAARWFEHLHRQPAAVS